MYIILSGRLVITRQNLSVIEMCGVRSFEKTLSAKPL